MMQPFKETTSNPAETDTETEVDTTDGFSHKFWSTGHNVRSDDEIVSLSIAARSLREIKDAIEEGNLEADELLDLSAEALDDAALSIRSVLNLNNKCEKNEGGETTNNKLFETVQSLALEVINARRPLLVISSNLRDPETPHSYPSPSVLDSVSTKKKKVSKKISTPLVVWASQTGTSRKLAFRLSDQLRSVCGEVECVNMKHVTVREVARHKRVYFVCSTFGVGRPPRDGEDFFHSLRCSKRDDGIWDGVEFAVASLGNSAFEFFAVFGQMLSHEVKGRGGEEIVPVTLIDMRDGKKKNKKKLFAAWEKMILSDFQGGSGTMTPVPGDDSKAKNRKKKSSRRRFPFSKILLKRKV